MAKPPRATIATVVTTSSSIRGIYQISQHLKRVSYPGPDIADPGVFADVVGNGLRSRNEPVGPAEFPEQMLHALGGLLRQALFEMLPQGFILLHDVGVVPAFGLDGRESLNDRFPSGLIFHRFFVKGPAVDRLHPRGKGCIGLSRQGENLNLTSGLTRALTAYASGFPSG